MRYDIQYFLSPRENLFLWICEKVLILRPIKTKQMARQHCNILISKGIQSLKSFERNAYVQLPSTLGTSYLRTVRPFCFSNPTDISQLPNIGSLRYNDCRKVLTKLPDSRFLCPNRYNLLHRDQLRTHISQSRLMTHNSHEK